jgi:hypothetical protein
LTRSATSVLYAVRCRFTDQSREPAWNDWYAGHIEVLLGVPGFLTAQRFRAPSPADERPYLALYEVAAAEVFESAAYRAIWGFDEWRPLIDNWTRDLFEPADGGAVEFATPAAGALRAAFVSGEDGAVRSALHWAAARRPTRTAFIVGLDRSCQAIAWETHVDPAAGRTTGWPSGVTAAEAVYMPLGDCRRASGAIGTAQ